MLDKLAGFRFGRAIVGPGILVMLADADAGNVVTAADAGAQWGYRLLPLLVLAAPLLYLFQELTIRLGVASGQGFAEAVARVFGGRWALFLGLVLFVSGIGNLVAQFSGIAGVGDMWGVHRTVLLAGVAMGIIVLLATNSYRRIERIALFIALFELAFFLAAWKAGPSAGAILRQLPDQPLLDTRYHLSAAALVGAVFNPWMIFYQQSAVAERRLSVEEFGAECAETGVGAVLTQALTAAMLLSVAATVTGSTSLSSIGEIADALAPLFGDTAGRVIFSLGVLGAALTSAIVSSLTIAWALGEAAGRHHLATERRPFGMFLAAQCAAILLAAFLVTTNSDLVWLNIASQTLNALLLPLVLVFLFLLARRVLPDALRPSRRSRAITLAGAVIVSAIGLFGGVASLVN